MCEAVNGNSRQNEPANGCPYDPGRLSWAAGRRVAASVAYLIASLGASG
jgi:hypothetical protein